MTAWLQPVREALDQAPVPRIFFCRDDDVGWEDERLFALLEVFAEYNVPVDLAIIPAALTPTLAQRLLARLAAAPGSLAVHQHGLAHQNHAHTGRKCEFGENRTIFDQRRDIAAGQQQLRSLLGTLVEPIFTPPWNRCTATTGACLVDLGFQVLSRDASATPLEIDGLREMPVRVDWFASHKGVRLSRPALGRRLAAALNTPGPIGIMFHHAFMDANEQKAARALLHLLATHEQARCSTIVALATEDACRASSGIPHATC